MVWLQKMSSVLATKHTSLHLETISWIMWQQNLTCPQFKMSRKVWKELFWASLHSWPRYLGDNDRAARVLFVQHPREQGEWCSQNPSVIIRPAPEGAGRTTPEQTGHYSHYYTKLTNSRYFHGNSYRIALIEPPSRPSCSWKSSEHCHPRCT